LQLAQNSRILQSDSYLPANRLFGDFGLENDEVMSIPPVIMKTAEIGGADTIVGNPGLGVRLRHARLVKGLRLKDLADLANCSESMISKIENNKSAPSLNTLHRIAKALATSVAELLQDRSAIGQVVQRKGERQIMSETGGGGASAETEVMIPFGSSSMLQAFVVRLEPGRGSGGNLQHEGEEVGYVKTGQLLLTVAGVAYQLNEGDSFFFASSSPHSFVNPGTTTTEIIWVNTPPSL
jgi:transcriptional regulator with XRE-family HTH domain